MENLKKIIQKYTVKKEELTKEQKEFVEKFKVENRNVIRDIYRDAMKESGFIAKGYLYNCKDGMPYCYIDNNDIYFLINCDITMLIPFKLFHFHFFSSSENKHFTKKFGFNIKDIFEETKNFAGDFEENYKKFNTLSNDDKEILNKFIEIAGCAHYNLETNSDDILKLYYIGTDKLQEMVKAKPTSLKKAQLHVVYRKILELYGVKTEEKFEDLKMEKKEKIEMKVQQKMEEVEVKKSTPLKVFKEEEIHEEEIKINDDQLKVDEKVIKVMKTTEKMDIDDDVEKYDGFSEEKK